MGQVTIRTVIEVGVTLTRGSVATEAETRTQLVAEVFISKSHLALALQVLTVVKIGQHVRFVVRWDTQP